MTERITIVLMCSALTAALFFCSFSLRVFAYAHAIPHQKAQLGWVLQPKIAWSSTRDDPTINPFLAAQVYIANPDFSAEERITTTANAANFFPVLSPAGKRMVFDSNRLRGSGRLNTSDLFLMTFELGTEQHLVRGSSATWSPGGQKIAYHASASGTGLPISGDPGAATTDSDIFVLSIDEWLEAGESPVNLTNSPEYIDQDADWSPDGSSIVFTRQPVGANAAATEIYRMNPDGSGVTQLTFNGADERGPEWSPDGSRIVYACRIGPAGPTGVPTFEICVMNADGSNPVQLTFNTVADVTPSWSLDGLHIVFHRPVAGLEQLFRMNIDGTGTAQLTNTVGRNLLASQGFLRVAGVPGKDGSQ